MIRSSSHGSNTRSGRNRNGCGYTPQDSLNDGAAVTLYLIYLRILFGNGSERVTDPNEPVQAWDIRDWQHQGYQRILSRLESFATLYPHDQSLAQGRNSDAVPIEETFTYATPFSHGDRQAASQLASVLYGDTRNAQRGDLSFPSSERFRAVSRSPRRGGYVGQR